MLGNPLHDLLLLRYGHTTQGFIIDTYEEPPDRREGKTDWTYEVTYKYSIPDGREFINETGIRSGKLPQELRPPLIQPYPVEVEYLPDEPHISRLKGSAPKSVTGWFLRKVVLGALVLILFLAVGIMLLRDALQQYRRSKNNKDTI